MKFRSLRRLFLLVWVASFATFFSSCTTDLGYDASDNLPKLTSFTPAQGTEGSTVVLTGKFSTLLASNKVSFNGKTATVVSVNSSGTALTVTVPADATTGKIAITVNGKTATAATDFVVNPLAPTITSISPEAGEAGATIVTISGTNFNNATVVYFNGLEVAASNVTFVSKTQLTAKVPAGATTGKVKVKVGSLEALSAVDFYIKPTITNFTPTTAAEGEEVTITGTNFSVNSAVPNVVKFGTVAVAPANVTVVSATELKAKVPAGLPATGVKISIEVKGQTATFLADFTLKPPVSITTVAPMQGEPGTEVTLTGAGLTQVTKVFIGTQEATIKTGTIDGQLIFIIPASFNGATDNTGAVKLVAGTSEQTAPGTFTVTNVWKKMSSYASGTIANRYGYMVSFNYNDKIFWGFANTGSSFANDLLSYDIASPGTPVTVQTNNPASVTQPEPRSTMSSVVFGDRAYIFGGFAGTSSNYNDIWEYNMGTNTFTKKATVLPTAVDGSDNRSYHAFVVAGHLYFYMYDNTNRHRIYEYDPVADNLITTPFMSWVNSPGLNYTEIQTIGNTVYFIGNKKIIELDMTTKTFSEHTLPTSVAGIDQRNFINFISGGKIYLGGGFCSSCSSAAATDFYVFDPAISVTTRLADIPQLKYYKNPFGVKSGRGYVLADNGMYQYIPNP